MKEFNASNPDNPFPLLYNGNTGPIPNIDPANLAVQFQPNMAVQVIAANGATGYTVPFDVRPINPNNLSEYIVNPLVDLPGQVTVNVTANAFTTTAYFSSNGLITYSAAITSLYNIPFDDAGNATSSFHVDKGRGYVNAPVAPAVIYYLPESGTGMGAINLDGNGFETNDPSVEKLAILTNVATMCTCFVVSENAGSHLAGCNGNTFGTQAQAVPPGTVFPPIGIAGNPPGTHLGPSTPIPGVNEGSVGSTAGLIYPPGFETVVRDSTGDARLIASPTVGALTDGEIGGFLDSLFFDTSNLGALGPLHTSFLTLLPGPSNFISDPPTPNPPPLRLPVGLPPVDVVFSQQKLLEPAFVIEGDEVWSACVGCNTLQSPPNNPLQIPCTGQERVLLVPNPINPLAGDVIPSFPQNGPYFQTFFVANPYAARQQIGNFLYMADRDFGSLTVINSNTFQVIDRVNLPDPWGVGVAPDLRRVYVSNFGGNSVSVVQTDPLQADFHKEIARVNVGDGPIAVSVQPGGEDVHIVNNLGDSVSVLEVSSLTIRTTYSGTMKRPVEVILTPRMSAIGWLSGIYMGYVASQGTGDILIYESGPSGADGFGADDIKWAASQTSAFEDMRGMCFDPIDYPGAITSFWSPTAPNPLLTGVYLTHRDADTGLAMVTRLVYTRQLPGVGAFPNNPLPGTILSSPGVVQRIFEPVGFWGGPLVPFFEQMNPGGQDQSPADVALSDFTTENFFKQIPTVGFNGNVYKTNIGSVAAPGVLAAASNHKSTWRTDSVGAPIPANIPDRMYVTFAGDNRIVVLDPTGVTAGPINVIEGATLPGRLINWYDQ